MDKYSYKLLKNKKKRSITRIKQETYKTKKEQEQENAKAH